MPLSCFGDVYCSCVEFGYREAVVCVAGVNLQETVVDCLKTFESSVASNDVCPKTQKMNLSIVIFGKSSFSHRY